ncbi:DUF4192 family protein [Diaminobutyricimonas sp. TR449]|uniref:DUF4192 family protein n=1 Tax=Diaminobutyricimonas sp. TR449 TaxID=2708076 RepID=UPI001421BD90|nr:DUF4192 family protein [Diaminobutyricimonas sp. TR449]
MPTVVKAQQPQDFLALVPQLAGFQPRNSVVLVAFRGKRTCGAMRFDLPNSTSPKVHKAMALTIVGMLCKIPGVDALVPVVYTDELIGDGPVAQLGFARALIRRARLSGLQVRDALCHAADGWASYLDPDLAVRPLREVAESPVNDLIDAELPDAADGARLPDADLVVKEQVGRALRDLTRRIERFEADVEAYLEDPDTAIDDAGSDLDDRAAVLDDFEAGLDDPMLMFEAALHAGPEALDPAACARLLFCVQHPPTRDAVMLQFAWGIKIGEAVLDSNLRYASDHTVDEVIEEASRRLLGDAPRPDPGRIEQAVHLLKWLATVAPRAARPAPLVMLAWLNWALGRGTSAALLIVRALEIDAEYGMATLLRQLFASGRLPEWAFAADDQRLDQDEDPRVAQ